MQIDIEEAINNLNQEEQTALEKKLELQQHDEWTRARIKRDWNETARQSRLAIIAKYGTPLQAPVEHLQTNYSDDER